MFAVPKSFSNFSMGRYFSCLVDNTGKPFCWGDNSFGQLGRGEAPSDGFNTPYGPVVGDLTVITEPPVR